jgi:DNA polymerase III subunit delta
MITLTSRSLEIQLKTGRLSALYLLVGPEVYLRDRAAAAITEQVLRGVELREFNEAAFSLTSLRPAEALAVAEQLPMMAQRRVVRLKDFGKLREADEEALVRYLNRPVPSTVAIFIADELDKRRKLTRTLLESCTVVEFPALKDGEARAWAAAYLHALKVNAGERAVAEIVARVGTDLQTLSVELEKLATAALDGTRLTVDLIDALTNRTRELSNFALADDLAAGNRQQALKTLHRLLDSGAEPLMLVGLMAGSYHRLALAQDLLRRSSEDEVFRQIAMPPFKRKQYLTTLRRTDPTRIARGLELIAATDLAIKTSQATPRLQLEMLVAELAR